ncbi:MAG TPA: hypothetical protein VE782_01340 [Myxococcaceae bacterium]|nr:hypothetical protein [Myxococcaceae bacterium]
MEPSDALDLQVQAPDAIIHVYNRLNVTTGQVVGEQRLGAMNPRH